MSEGGSALLTRPKPRYQPPRGSSQGYTVTVTETPKPVAPPAQVVSTSQVINAQTQSQKALSINLAKARARALRPQFRGSGAGGVGGFFTDAGIHVLVDYQLANYDRLAARKQLAADRAEALGRARARLQRANSRRVRITKPKTRPLAAVQSPLTTKPKEQRTSARNSPSVERAFRSSSTQKTNPLQRRLTNSLSQRSARLSTSNSQGRSLPNSKSAARSSQTGLGSRLRLPTASSALNITSKGFLTTVNNRLLGSPALSLANAGSAGFNFATGTRTATKSCDCPKPKKERKSKQPARECVQKITETKEVTRCLQFKSKSP